MKTESKKNLIIFFIALFGFGGIGLHSLEKNNPEFLNNQIDKLNNFISTFDEFDLRIKDLDINPIDYEPRAKEQQDNQISLKNCYYQTASGYIAKSEQPDKFNSSLKLATNHFEIHSSPEISNNEKEFIIANLENQYCRYYNIYGVNPLRRIEINITDDLDFYQETIGYNFINDPIFQATESENKSITIYSSSFGLLWKMDQASKISMVMGQIFEYTNNNDIVPDWFYFGMNGAFTNPINWYEQFASNEYISEQDAINKLESSILDTYSSLNDMENSLYSEDEKTRAHGYDSIQLFFIYLTKTYGQEDIINFHFLTNTNDFEEDFINRFGVSPDQAFKNWIDTL